MSLHLRAHGRHRITPAELHAENRRLRDENNDLACALAKLAAEVDQRDAWNRDAQQHLDEAAIEHQALKKRLRAAEQRADLLLAKLRNAQADLANATAIDVPPMVRDIEKGLDDATWPAGIDCRPIQERFAAGPVVTLHDSPQATSPTHIPGWAKPAA